MDVVIQGAGFELADPDADQLAGDVVALGQRMQRLTGDELSGNVPIASRSSVRSAPLRVDRMRSWI